MRILPCLVALLATLALASSAHAAQLSYDADGTLAYTAGSGEINSGLVDMSPYSTTCAPVVTPCIHIIDWGAFIDTSSLPAGCAGVNQTEGWPQYGESACPVPPRLRVDLGDMNDSWTDWEGPSVIDAGPGNDNPISGLGGDDVIHGGSGNDVLIGGQATTRSTAGSATTTSRGFPASACSAATRPARAPTPTPAAVAATRSSTPTAARTSRSASTASPTTASPARTTTSAPTSRPSSAATAPT